MNRSRLEQQLHAVWYGKSGTALALLPLSWLYCLLVWLRRKLYRCGILQRRCLDCRVMVVGNINVGGSGKTPLVTAIARRAQDMGLQVGILARGYRGRARHWPQAVHADSDPRQVGDEAVLLARETGAAVFAGPDRITAGRALLQAGPCDIIICDDGLQHLALQADTEIAVVDAAYGTGNGYCLPAGPLREPAARLREVDAVVTLRDNTDAAFSMRLQSLPLRCIMDPSQTCDLNSLRGQNVHAVAGIAHPQRFFDSLHEAGLNIRPHIFADHHPFQAAELDFGDNAPVLMTAKDALKCEPFARPNWWSVPVEAQLDASLEAWLTEILDQEP
ncbi:MAG TPA: tetraacyldisaccharide 4'-kinase [Gammaproteobacteria bacterium]|nr:tetraacyldisaccharide 4'-kinase [Gammaproteobacteria bacterium]